MQTSTQDKSAKYRQKMQSMGYRSVQLWIHDTRREDFRQRINRQCQAINGSEEEAEVLKLTHHAAELIEGWQ